MKALVTGGSGYFGEILAQKLLHEGYQVRIFDINKNTNFSSDYEFFKGDIRDKDAVINACQGVDIVFHNIAQVPLAKNRSLFETVNRDGTENILTAAKKNHISQFVYTSSSAVFGVPKFNPVTEETEPTPMEDYGKAKLAGERLCKKYADEELNISIVRPRTILGSGRLGIFQILFEWVHTGKNIPVFNDGKNIYQFVHADDLAQCCIEASKKQGFNIYNCGAKNFGTMRELLQALCDHAQTGSKIRSLPMKPLILAMNIFSKIGLSPLGAYHSLMYGRSMYFDISKAEKELNFKPKYSNEEMIKESYDWYIRNQSLIFDQGEKLSRHKSAVKQGVLKILGYLL